MKAAQDNDADIVGMSALLTTTMPRMKDTIDALSAAGLRELVKVIISGASVTEQYAAEVGADGRGANAVLAVDKAKELMSTRV